MNSKGGEAKYNFMQINSIKQKKQQTIAKSQCDYEGLLPLEIEKMAKELEKEEEIDKKVQTQYFPQMLQDIKKVQDKNLSSSADPKEQQLQCIETEQEKACYEDAIEYYSLCPLNKQCQVLNINYSQLIYHDMSKLARDICWKYAKQPGRQHPVSSALCGPASPLRDFCF